MEPGECLFIGDGGRELTGAVRVGVKAIQVRSADENSEEAARFSPEIWNGLVLSRLADLLTIALE